MKKEDFKQYVNLAMQHAGLASMRPVVEKELLHYEIFNALNEAGLLKHLVFQGGTSLRLCRGSDRFSEDLHFAGGKDFSAKSMVAIKDCIEKRIGEKFSLKVSVKEPKATRADALVKVDKWWVSIETSPGTPDLPRQKIKLQIANIPAYTRELVPLRINYVVLEGTPTVMVNAEAINEVLADKIVALPTSISKIENGNWLATPTRIRHRDIWDIAWLIQRGAVLNSDHVNHKIRDYGILDFERLLDFAVLSMPGIASGNEFKAQMQRFIDDAAFKRAFVPGFDAYLASTVNQQFNTIKPQLKNFVGLFSEE